MNESVFYPLIQFHDKELTKPIKVDETLDVGSYDVAVGFEKKTYLYNHNKHLAASVTTQNGNSIIIPPYTSCEMTFVLGPTPFDEERFMAEGYTQAIEQEPEEPIPKFGYSVSWLKTGMDD